MSDSDDDLPLSEFIKKRKRLEIEKLNNEKTKQTKTENIIKKEKTTTTSSNNFNNNSKGNYINKAAEFYDSTKKGFILQKLLCRWWLVSYYITHIYITYINQIYIYNIILCLIIYYRYAIDWPKLNDIAEAPVGYEGLDGFPGVFISTRVSSYYIYINNIYHIICII